jgi:hypothetical protein
VTASDTRTTWQDWAVSTPAFGDHELTFAGVLEESPTRVVLIFTGPHQSDADMATLGNHLGPHLELARQHLAGEGQLLLRVRRQPTENAANGSTPAPPNILVDIAREDQLDYWRNWAAGCTVLAEFDVVVTSIALNEGCVSLFLNSGRNVDVDDLRSQTPRIMSRVPERYVGGDISINPTSDMPGAQIMLTLHAPEPDRPDTPARPKTRQHWRGLLERHVTSRIPWHMVSLPISRSTQETIVLAVALALLLGLAITIGRFIGVMVMAFAYAIMLGAEWVGGTVAYDVVIGPVRAYLDANSGDPRYSGEAAFWLWAVAGIVTGLLGWTARSIGARIGWVLWGAATVAMTYASTSIGSKPVAAGVAAVWWTLGSLLVFRRTNRPRHVIATVPALYTDGESGHLTSHRGLDIAERARSLAYTVGQMFSSEPLDDATAPAERDEPFAWRAPKLPFPVVDAADSHLPFPAADVDVPPVDPDKRTWESFTDDSGVPGMIFHSKYTLADGSGFLLHYELPDDRTLDSIRGFIPRMELMLFKRHRHLFARSIVSPGCVTIEHATAADGSKVVGEVFVTVRTGPLVNATYANTRAKILTIVASAGAIGMTTTEIYTELQKNGFQMSRTALYPWLSKLANGDDTQPGEPVLYRASSNLWKVTQR